MTHLDRDALTEIIAGVLHAWQDADETYDGERAVAIAERLAALGVAGSAQGAGQRMSITEANALMLCPVCGTFPCSHGGSAQGEAEGTPWRGAEWFWCNSCEEPTTDRSGHCSLVGPYATEGEAREFGELGSCRD